MNNPLQAVVRVGESAVEQGSSTQIQYFSDSLLDLVQDSSQSEAVDIEEFMYALYLADYLGLPPALTQYAANVQLSKYRAGGEDTAAKCHLENYLGIQAYRSGKFDAARSRFREAQRNASQVKDLELFSAATLNLARVALTSRESVVEAIEEATDIIGTAPQSDAAVRMPLASMIAYRSTIRYGTDLGHDFEERIRTSRDGALQAARDAEQAGGRWNSRLAVDSLIAAACIVRDEAVRSSNVVQLREVTEALEVLAGYVQSVFSPDDMLTVISRYNWAQSTFEYGLMSWSDSLESALAYLEDATRQVTRVFGPSNPVSIVAESNYYTAALENTRADIVLGAVDRAHAESRLHSICGSFESLLDKSREMAAAPASMTSVWWGYAASQFDLARVSDSQEDWDRATAVAESAYTELCGALGRGNYSSQLLGRQAEVCRAARDGLRYGPGSVSVITRMDEFDWRRCFGSFSQSHAPARLRPQETPTDEPAEQTKESPPELQAEIAIGSNVEGRVGRSIRNEVLIRVPGFEPAVIPRNEFLFDEVTQAHVKPAVGSVVSGIAIAKRDEHPRILVSQRQHQLENVVLQHLREVQASRQELRVRVTAVSPRGLRVSYVYAGVILEGTIFADAISLGPGHHFSVRDSDEYVYADLVRFSTKTGELVLSRRSWLVRTIPRQLRRFLLADKHGSQYIGTVVDVAHDSIIIRLADYDVLGRIPTKSIRKHSLSIGDRVTVMLRSYSSDTQDVVFRLVRLLDAEDS